MLINQFRLLASRNFLPLFITQFLGAFNDNIFKSSLVVLITYKLVVSPGDAQMLINMAGGIFILPFFLFSATAGQLADKFKRTQIIQLVKLFEILFMLTAALGFHLSSIPLLMTTLFMMGIHSAFFGPIKYSSLPDLLQPNALLAGNGLVEGSTLIAILFGTILGSLLGVDIEGALWAAYIATIAAIVGLVSSFSIPQLPSAEPDLKINWNFITATGRLIAQVAKIPLMLNIISAISWFWLIGFVFVTQFPVYALSTLHANHEVVTLFLVMFSVGIAVGSLMCNRLLKGTIQLKYVPFAILGLSLFALDFSWASAHAEITYTDPLLGVTDFLTTFSGIRITLDLFLLSVCGGFYVVPLYAMMQTQSAANMRSRVIACNNIMNAVFMVVAAGLVIGLVGLGCTMLQLFAIMAIANVGIAIWAQKKFQKHKGNVVLAGTL